VGCRTAATLYLTRSPILGPPRASPLMLSMMAAWIVLLPWRISVRHRPIVTRYLGPPTRCSKSRDRDLHYDRSGYYRLLALERQSMVVNRPSPILSAARGSAPCVYRAVLARKSTHEPVTTIASHRAGPPDQRVTPCPAGRAEWVQPPWPDGPWWELETQRLREQAGAPWWSARAPGRPACARSALRRLPR
jgi:hypothetical protein